MSHKSSHSTSHRDNNTLKHSISPLQLSSLRLWSTYSRMAFLILGAYSDTTSSITLLLITIGVLYPLFLYHTPNKSDSAGFHQLTNGHTEQQKSFEKPEHLRNLWVNYGFINYQEIEKLRNLRIRDFEISEFGILVVSESGILVILEFGILVISEFGICSFRIFGFLDFGFRYWDLYK